jgi:hypothetical protein
MYVCRYYRLSCSQSKTQTGQVKTTTSAGLVLLLLLLLLSDTYTWKYENVLKGRAHQHQVPYVPYLYHSKENFINPPYETNFIFVVNDDDKKVLLFGETIISF